MGGRRPDHGRRREGGRRCRGDDPRRPDHDPGRRHLRRVQRRRRPVRVVERRDGCRRLSDRGRLCALRRAHEPADAPADRLPRRATRRGRGERQPAGPLRRQSRLPRATRRGDDDAAGRPRRCGPVLRRLQGADGRQRDRRSSRSGRCRHGQRGAGAAAGVDGMAADRDRRRVDHARLREAARVERTRRRSSSS